MKRYVCEGKTLGKINAASKILARAADNLYLKFIRSIELIHHPLD
jgi:hypothetical protein